jgi:hypothetical protein
MPGPFSFGCGGQEETRRGFSLDGLAKAGRGRGLASVSGMLIRKSFSDSYLRLGWWKGDGRVRAGLDGTCRASDWPVDRAVGGTRGQPESCRGRGAGGVERDA